MYFIFLILVYKWLYYHQLANHYNTLKEHNITTIDSLLSTNDDVLKECNISESHLKRIRQSIVPPNN